ncbi:MAG: hypothetical protein L0Y56_08890 [Nitrospira sp.]|nr:hypothetical protein [Nitrospira sp.]
MEHVIPDYLFGEFIIYEVCQSCNNNVGSSVESCMPSHIAYAKFLKTGIIRGQATAIIGGKEIKGIAEIVEQRVSGGSFHLKSFKDEHGTELRDKVESINLTAYDLGLEEGGFSKKLVPVVSKIAFAGIHYLLNYGLDQRLKYPTFVDCPELGNLRQQFNPGARVWPGKKYCGLSFTHIGFPHWRGYREKWEDPLVRRHYLEIKQNGNDAEVLIILLSDWAWKVTIKDFELPVSPLSAESLLPKLTNISPEDREEPSTQGQNQVPSRVNIHVDFKKKLVTPITILASNPHNKPH